MILQIKESYLKEQELGKFYEYALISLIVFVIAMIMSFIFSKYVQELLDNLSNTRKSNRELKSKVREKNRELLKSNEELQHLNENLEQKIEEEIAKNKEKEVQLFAQAKLAAMGDMIGNIAHQWRQPLAIISTVASGIKLRYKYKQLNMDELPGQMDDIVDKTHHLSQTIDTFRNFLQEEKVFKEIILQESIQSSLKIIGSTLKDNNIKLKKDLCEENDIYLVEDCAQSIGALYSDKKVGTLGDISIFSFYATKMMTTIQGGMICTMTSAVRLRILTQD